MPKQSQKTFKRKVISTMMKHFGYGHQGMGNMWLEKGIAVLLPLKHWRIPMNILMEN